MTLREKMLAVIADVNAEVAEREELTELIAVALLTRNNLFILGRPGQAKSYSINLFRQHITGARQFERLLSKQTDEEQLFGRIDLASLIPGSVPEVFFEKDSFYKGLKEELDAMEAMLKEDMAEQRELFDSIRPDVIPTDFFMEPETAPPLPTEGIYLPEDLEKIYETVSAEIPTQTEEIPLEIVETSIVEIENPVVEEENPIIENVDIEEIPEIPQTPEFVEEPPEDSPLEEVKTVNRQAIAWLTIPDTDLDYPIAQAEDNEFYLWKGFNGERNGTGTPFLDYRCKPDFSGYNSIIYGHNMEQMLMFATISKYRDKSFMEEHPEGWLLLDDGLHKIQFFAYLSVQSNSAIYQTVFVTPQEFEEYKELMFECAVYTMDVPEEINHVILLSTCTFERENQRGILVGKLT